MTIPLELIDQTLRRLFSKFFKDYYWGPFLEIGPVEPIRGLDLSAAGKAVESFRGRSETSQEVDVNAITAPSQNIKDLVPQY